MNYEQILGREADAVYLKTLLARRWGASWNYY